MGTVRSSERTKQYSIVGLVLLAQLIILTRTFPVFLDGDAFFYFAHHLNSWEDLKKCILAPDAARQYRPLGQILFSYVFYPMFKLNHTLYAAVALSFHMTNTVLAFLVFRRLLKSKIAIISATIFWGLNPVAIYVTHSFSFLADFTFAFFYFLAVLSFLKYIDTGKLLYGLGVLASFVLSLICKEMAVTLPAVLVFITIAFLVDDVEPSLLRSRSKWIFYIMFAGLAVYLSGYVFMKGGRFYDIESKQNYYFNFSVQTLIEKLEYLLTAFFMPFPEYRQRPGVVPEARLLALFTFPFLALFSFFVLWPGVRRNSKMWLGFFLSFLMLTPVLFINPSEFIHNIYVPLAGLAIAVGIFFDDFSQLLKDTKWFRPEMIYLYALAVVFSSLLVNQEIFLKIGWRTHYEKMARGAVTGLKNLHLNLTHDSVLYILRSHVLEFPWYVFDGLYFNFYFNDPMLTTRFQQWNEPFPMQEIKDKKGFVLVYTDNRFFDMTKKYVDEMYNKKGIKLLNSFEKADVYVPPSAQGSTNLGTPENKLAFTATFLRNNDPRVSMVTLASAKVRFEIPVLTKESRLVIGTARAFDMGDGAEGRIYFEANERRTLIYSRFIDPANRPQDRVWFDEVILLGQFAGTLGNLIFECNPGPRGNADADWFLWSLLRLEGTDQVR